MVVENLSFRKAISLKKKKYVFDVFSYFNLT